MTSQPPDPLSELLRRWAERRAPDDAQAAGLRARVAAAIRETALLDLPAASPTRPVARLWGRVFWFALGAAAAIMVVCVFPPCNQQGEPAAVHREQSEGIPPFVQIQQSQLAEKSGLLAGMEELFGGRLAWLAEDGGQVQLGLLPDAALPPGAKPLVVRVVVVARKAGNADWKPVWRTDLVTHDEQLIELAQEQAEGASLRMWTQRLADGMIAVDFELALGGRLPVRCCFSGIQRAGVPQRVFLLQTDDAEYQVYQTVAPLPKKVG